MVRQRSAKPRSPVQIRAAPPNFRFKFDGLCSSGTSRRSQLDYGGPQIVDGPRGRIPQITVCEALRCSRVGRGKRFPGPPPLRSRGNGAGWPAAAAVHLLTRLAASRNELQQTNVRLRGLLPARAFEPCSTPHISGRCHADRVTERARCRVLCRVLRSADRRRCCRSRRVLSVCRGMDLCRARRSSVQEAPCLTQERSRRRFSSSRACATV